jgi:ABC-2 type transport system permease protein
LSQVSALGGAIRYEFVMQLRRPALWIGFSLISTLLFFAFGSMTSPGRGVAASHREILVLWTIACTFLLTLGAGLLLADRTPRDRKTRVGEILRTSPASPLARLGGKYLGGVAATLIPIFLIYAIGVGVLIAQWIDFSLLPVALATFVTISVPAVLFVGAFSIACTNVLWTPLYQFLFVGYWLWTNLNPGEAIPTLSGTLLSPAGNYVVTGFFHFGAYVPIDKGFYPDSSIGLGVANIAVLLGCATIALLAAWGWQCWQASYE